MTNWNVTSCHFSTCRYRYLNTGSSRFETDGLNSIQYKLLNISQYKLFTSFSVDINESEVMKQFQKRVTEVPPVLSRLKNLNKDNLNALTNEIARQKDKQKTANFYTIVNQSDIQQMIAKMEKTVDSKKPTAFALPEAKTWEPKDHCDFCIEF